MRLLFTALACLISVSLFGQLPNGSTAPNFTAVDIDGQEWNLYTLLDEGKTVILHFSATWCGPCWTYANDGILEDLYSTFGPNGTDDIMVFYLESDDWTTIADLNGTGSSTTGDWVSIINFPIIDNAANIFADYSNSYYPTIYTVCPDYTLVESGQTSFEGHIEAAFAPCDNAVNGAAPLMSYNGDTSACGGEAWTASTVVNNIGTDQITTMTLEVTLNGSAQPDVNWYGNLASGGSEVIDLGTYTETGNLDVTLVEVNGEDWEAHQDIDVVGSVESTTYVQVRIRTDNWPDNTGWSIENSNGTQIAGVAQGQYANQPNELIITDVALDLNECYLFTITDSFGDGLYASQWGYYSDGYAQIVSMYGDTELGIIFDYQGDSGIEFFELTQGIYPLADDIIINFGCIDPAACNYDPFAEFDDGSCTYPGCTDSTAINYDANAGCDDGACISSFGALDIIVPAYMYYSDTLEVNLMITGGEDVYGAYASLQYDTSLTFYAGWVVY